jgi:hypothetical protein
MAQMTMSLDRDEIAEAVGEWLESRGFKVTGPVTIAHTPGAQDSGGFATETFTASANVERVTRKKATTAGSEGA